MNNNFINRKQLLEVLGDLKVSISLATLQNYVDQKIIDEPHYSGSGRGRGSTAQYPRGTVGTIYAVRKLIQVGLTWHELQGIIKISRYLESRRYGSVKQIIADTELSKYLISSRLALYSALFLQMKHEIEDYNYMATLPKNEEVLFYLQNLGTTLLSGTLAGCTFPLSHVTQGLLVMIANQENKILSQLK